MKHIFLGENGLDALAVFHILVRKVKIRLYPFLPLKSCFLFSISCCKVDLWCGNSKSGPSLELSLLAGTSTDILTEASLFALQESGPKRKPP